jgi:hypothetical protein
VAAPRVGGRPAHPRPGAHHQGSHRRRAQVAFGEAARAAPRLGEPQHREDAGLHRARPAARPPRRPAQSGPGGERLLPHGCARSPPRVVAAESGLSPGSEAPDRRLVVSEWRWRGSVVPHLRTTLTATTAGPALVAVLQAMPVRYASATTRTPFYCADSRGSSASGSSVRQEPARLREPRRRHVALPEERVRRSFSCLGWHVSTTARGC